MFSQSYYKYVHLCTLDLEENFILLETEKDV